MNNFVRWIGWFLQPLMLVVLLMPLRGVAGEGERLLERFLSQTRTLSAAFQQTLRADDGFVMQQSEGRFYLARPGRFRWDYEKPYQQQIVSDGDRVYIYDVDLQQVTVQQQNAALSNTPMALMQDKATLTDAYKVQELDSRDGVYRLKLVSKKGDGDFNGIVVGVDQTGLRFLQLKDQFNQVTDIVFDALQTNPKLQSGLFEFTPPEGVDVFSGG